MVGENTQPKISLAELLELRSDGLTPSELLSLLSSSCEFLTRTNHIESPEKLFSLCQMFVTRDGRVEILLTSNLSTEFRPPELSDQVAEYQILTEPNLIWCLGMSCLRLIQSSVHSDVALFSLLNLMTVGHVQSRPTLSKVWQMVRNQLGIVQLAKVQEVIANLFKEVMGDLDELLADPFDDDIRFSSSRSSKLSIIPGPGAPEQQKNETSAHHQNLFVSQVADRLRGEIVLSHESAANPFDDNYGVNSVDIPEKIQLVNMPFQQHLHQLIQQQNGSESSADEDGSTPRETTPIPKREQRDAEGEESNPNVEQNRTQKREMEPTSDMNGHSVEGRHPPNTQPIEAEVHSSAQSSLKEQRQQAQLQKPTGRLYAKAAQIGRVPRAVVKKEAEIEILSYESERRIGESFLDSSDGAACCESVAAPVSGYSPGTRRKVPQDKDTQREAVTEEQSAQFQRKNSLEPSRCSKRRESFGQRRALPGTKSASLLPTVPEFLSSNNRPIIRLRAQSMKRKKIVSLHRSDSAVVFVRLLNGHVVEVNCRTDTSIGSVFHTVAEHLNITEHLFFGLTLQRQNGENIFLEEHQRLEKWAPPGWKGGTGLRRSFGAGGTLSRHIDHSACGGVEQFILLLRFRYYPKKREFVKTANTAHQLYLQLRQDILSGTLRFSPKERAMEMAALALCAEAHAMPKEVNEEYFRMDDYLPLKFYGIEPNDFLQTQQRIAERHRRLAASFGYLEAEEQFIARCQAEPLYGAHFYRVHKIKPKRGYSAPSRPFLSDTRIIAVIPSGICICREERNGTQRQLNSTHDWHTIRTLQFDRKRFLLGTIEGNIAVDHVFYTDHHSKASYLVRFAASQHRFMLKMRQWQGTLNRMHLGEWQKDVGVEQRRRSEEVASDELGLVKNAHPSHARNTSHPQMGIELEDVSHNQSDHLFDNNRLMFETEKEYIEYFYGSEAQRIDICLEKDPMHGLGLTLIDGDMNGVKTVFVKSLSSEGNGKRKGLLVGDCLLSVNGVSLFNKSRHDAVQLVANSAREVRLQLLRFPSVSEVLAQSSPSPPNIDKTYNENNRQNEKPSSVGLVRQHFANASVKEKRTDQNEETTNDDNLRKKESSVTNESKLSSTSEGTSNSTISSAQKRQRAVSDFGASYLPALRTDDILALGPTTAGQLHERPQRYRRHKTSAGVPESNLFDSDSDSSDGQSGKVKKFTDATKRGEYKPQLPTALSMYSFLGDEEEETVEEAANGLLKTADNTRMNIAQRLRPNFAINSLNKDSPAGGRSPFASAVERFARVENATDSISWSSAKLSAKDERYSKGINSNLNLDWANCLSDVDGAVSSPPSSSPSPASSPSDRKQKKFIIRIARVTSVDSLPFKVRALPGKGIFVSEIFAEKMPRALTLRVGDQIVAIDGVSVIGYILEKFVAKIISGPFEKAELELTVERAVMREDEEAEEQTLTVTLDKTQNGAIGLSLAKRMGSDGVFVRNIAPDSIAAREGTLRVGDRIWRVQGEQIAAGESPANVVKRLKDLSGQFGIEVRRRKE